MNQTTESITSAGRLSLSDFAWSIALTVLALAVGAAIFVSRADANHYHTNCVGHGFVHGSSTTDNSFFARVEGGCGNPGSKVCRLSQEGSTYRSASIGAGSNGTCNVWNNGIGGELSSYATVDFNGVFASHTHFPH